MTDNSAVYLHFLDRELTSTADQSKKISGAASIQYLRTLTFFTQRQLYCGLSAIWENDRIASRAAFDLEIATELNILNFVSHDLSFDEFFANRQSAYLFDSGRYPRYFDDHAPLLSWSRASLVKPRGSTQPLIAHLTDWASRLPQEPSGMLQIAQLGGPVLTALERRQGEGVTFSLFRPVLGQLGDEPFAVNRIRREISKAFTLDYMRYLGGDIASGIPGLEFFDRLSDGFPVLDMQILQRLSALTGMTDVLDPAEGYGPDAWRMIAAARDSQAAILLAETVAWLLRALFSRDQSRTPSAAQDPDSFRGFDQVRLRIREDLRVALRKVGDMAPLERSIAPQDYYVLSRNRLMQIASALKDHDMHLASYLDGSSGSMSNAQINVMAVTVTEVESEALHTALKNAGFSDRPEFSQSHTYRLYSGPGGVVAHIRSSMGSSGRGGSTLTVSSAIRELSPPVVIAVGIAFGFDESKQPIGRVLVSQRLSSYELQKVGTSAGGEEAVVSRGPSTEANPPLVGRFRDSRLQDIGIDLQVGEIVSGDKLIDNPTFRDALKSRYPEAIGGEMEGAGVQAAADNGQTPWLVLKAVCDYAESKSIDKKNRQLIAAAEAAKAFVHVLKSGAFSVSMRAR